MDHGGMDHGGMNMGHKCNMNVRMSFHPNKNSYQCVYQMLFTWDTTNLCIIFHWWHITSTFTLLISLVAVAILTAGYEVVREASRKYECSSTEYANSLPSK